MKENCIDESTQDLIIMMLMIDVASLLQGVHKQFNGVDV